MGNAVLCRFCGTWIHERCAEIERVTNKLAIDAKCRKCKGYHENVEDQKENLHEDVETVTDFACLGDRIFSVGECEAGVASRTRLVWVELGITKIYFAEKISLKIIIYYVLFSMPIKILVIPNLCEKS